MLVTAQAHIAWEKGDLQRLVSPQKHVKGIMLLLACTCAAWKFQ